MLRSRNKSDQKNFHVAGVPEHLAKVTKPFIKNIHNREGLLLAGKGSEVERCRQLNGWLIK